MENPIKKRETKKKETKKPIQFIPSLEPKLGRIYSNYVSVSHSPWDFTIRFSDAPPFGDISRLAKDGVVEIPNLVEIIIPINLMPKLVDVFRENLNQFQKNIEAATKITEK
jgi:hypothetical protein